MSTTRTLPAGYSMPLRRREEIARYLAYGEGTPSYSTRKARERSDCGIFCFDVRCYRPNLCLDHLLGLYETYGHGTAEDYWTDPRWLQAAATAYKNIRYDGCRGEDALCSLAFEEARESLNDEDTWKCLWWGREDATFDATYDFVGRSGGWLRLVTWGTEMKDRGLTWSRKWDFTTEDPDYWFQKFRGNPHKQGTYRYDGWFSDYGDAFSWYELRKLYATIRMLEWDFQSNKVTEYVEDAACFRLFASYLEEIEDPRLPGWQKSEASCAALVGARSSW